jgi:hypothetical protein
MPKTSRSELVTSTTDSLRMRAGAAEVPGGPAIGPPLGPPGGFPLGSP